MRRIAVPASWYLGAHGDPIAQFDYLELVLHDDGTVTWEDNSRDPSSEGGGNRNPNERVHCGPTHPLGPRRIAAQRLWMDEVVA